MNIHNAHVKFQNQYKRKKSSRFGMSVSLFLNHGQTDEQTITLIYEETLFEYSFSLGVD